MQAISSSKREHFSFPAKKPVYLSFLPHIAIWLKTLYFHSLFGLSLKSSPFSCAASRHCQKNHILVHSPNIHSSLLKSRYFLLFQV